MSTVPEIIEQIFLESDVALLAAQEEILNVSAFARKIQPQVANIAQKDVAEGTIATALSRYLSEFTPPVLKPEITLESIQMSAPVSVLTYPNTPVHLMNISQLVSAHLEISRDFIISQSQKEITVMISSRHIDNMLDQVGKPVVQVNDLAAVSVSFKKEYVEQPNIIYTLLVTLAVRRINIIELFSTSTSLTVVVNDKDHEQTLRILKRFV